MVLALRWTMPLEYLMFFNFILTPGIDKHAGILEQTDHQSYSLRNRTTKFPSSISQSTEAI